MIDLHSHILPGLDDGASSIDEAMVLLRQYARQEVRAVVCTPHIKAEHIAVESKMTAYLKSRQQMLEQLRSLALQEKIPVELHSGGEFVLTPDLPRCLARLENPGLAGSDYLLVELPLQFSGGIHLLDNLLFAIQMAGYMPLLAHPERSMHSEGVTEIFADWVKKERLLLQINASSLVSLPDWPQERISRFKKRLLHVQLLLAEKLVFCVASDAHNRHLRPVMMQEAQKEVERIAGREYARTLFSRNPQAVLDNIPPETI